MGVISSFRDRRHDLTGPESVATLSYMEDFFQDGANWTQGVYHAANGAKCLVGAADHVRVTSIDDAKHWLSEAIAERGYGETIEEFNDHSPTYDEVAAVIERAKQLAARASRVLPRSLPDFALTGEILPPLGRNDRRNVPVVVPTPVPAKRRMPLWRGVLAALGIVTIGTLDLFLD